MDGTAAEGGLQAQPPPTCLNAQVVILLSHLGYTADIAAAEVSQLHQEQSTHACIAARSVVREGGATSKDFTAEGEGELPAAACTVHPQPRRVQGAGTISCMGQRQRCGSTDPRPTCACACALRSPCLTAVPG